ncbi:MAG: PaaI family thioesterase [Pseudomonadota bacterium]
MTAPSLRTRSYDYAVSPPDLAAAATLTGLEQIQAMLDGRGAAPPSMAATMGLSAPTDLAEGRAAFEAETADWMLNPLGSVHGGFAATLLDSALGVCVHTSLPPGFGYTTAELKINYTRALPPTGLRVRAVGEVVHRGRRMATAEARLTGVEDGRLYAHGSTTCFIFPSAERAAA